MCKIPRDFDFWNSQSARVAFSAEFRNRPAGIRRRNFFPGGRRKNAVFSPREKSEFPLQKCSVNLHYKIGGQIWSGNPAENRPPPRPPRRGPRRTVSPVFRPSLQTAAGIPRPTAENRVRGRISNFGGVSHGPPARSFGKGPPEAGSRGLGSAAFFPPQPDFSHQKSGGLLIFAYSLLATLPRSTPLLRVQSPRVC